MIFQCDPIFDNNLVLPLGKAFQITGQAKAGSTVTAALGSQRYATQASKSGRFCLRFRAVLQSQASIQLTNGGQQLQLQCHFGEVYLFSGQSNVEFRLKDAQTYAQTLAAFPKLNAYYYEVPQVEYVQADGTRLPTDLPAGHWQRITPETCGQMSAIAFYTVVTMQKEHPQTTIGIVDCYKGGTSASAWIPEAALKRHADLIAAYVKPFQAAIAGKSAADFAKEQTIYQQKVEQHNHDLAAFQAAHPDVSLSRAKAQVGHTPWPPPAQPTSYLRPHGLFDTMVSQIAAFTFNQMIWYQGENDADHPDLYATLLSTLVTTWRDVLHDRSLPVNIIQLPGYEDEPPEAWVKIRQAQLQVACTLPNTSLISIIDTGERHNIHPTAKQPVGERIGKILLNQVYSATPLPQIKRWDDKGLVLQVTQAQSLKLRGQPRFIADRSKRVTAIVAQTTLTITGNFQEIAYQNANYPEPTIFNELDFPLAAFTLKRQEPHYGLTL